MNIRDMTINDVDAVFAIGNDAPELAVSDVSRFWGVPRLRDWVQANQDIMLVAEQNNEIIGILLTQLHIPSHVGYVSDLVVKESARGEGVGHALMVEAVRRMTGMGLTYQYALTQQHNEKIQNLLEKDGFSRGETMVWFERKT